MDANLKVRVKTCIDSPFVNILLVECPNSNPVYTVNTDMAGCYKYTAAGFPSGTDPGPHTLPGLMTPTKCIDYCQGDARNFNAYAGIANGSDCYCATAVDPNNKVSASTFCTITCPGDSSQYCGGNPVDSTPYMSVYNVPPKP